MPLTGYAIRLKPDIADRYDCSYSGKFVSGSTLGPFRNGDLCRSDVAGDSLEGIELRVTERLVSESRTPGHEIEYSDVSYVKVTIVDASQEIGPTALPRLHQRWVRRSQKTPASDVLP